MSTKIQIRRDTASAWTTNSSVVLSAGEIGYETDTHNMKIGDGTTTWATLKYQAPYYTAANSGAPNTLLALDVGNSRVGIGNSSPASTLDVTGQVRVRGTTAYSAPADNVAAINYDSTSGVMTVDARSNAGSTVIAVHTSNATAGAERLRISSTGNVGIGTNSPQDQVHIEGTGPVIRLKDTTSTTAEYATIDANTSTGSISINANQGNLAGVQASALVALKVNSTERLRANGTGVQVTGSLSADNGLSITTTGGGSVSFPSGSIAGATIATGGITATQLASNAVTTVKITDANVTRAKLSAMPKITVQAYYTGTGNFTVPAGVTSLKVTAVGGGGGGGSQNPGGAGGAGACATAIYSVTAGASYAYTVGAGGTGATYGSSSSSGTAGGATTFLSMSAGGGTAGAAAVAGSVGTYALTAAPSGTSILADFRPGLQGISEVKRDNLVAGNPALQFVPGATYPPGTGGAGSVVNGANSSSGNAASGGVGGMLIIEYIDMA